MIRLLALGCLLLWASPLLAQPPHPIDVLRALNEVRANPRHYAALLATTQRYYHGTEYRVPGQPILRTKEGWAAVAEAIGELNQLQPLPPLYWDPSLALAARDHVADLGPRGTVSHDSFDGSRFFDRIQRYGHWHRFAAENIQFGEQDALGIILQLLIDDGVPDRGHRRNLLIASSGKVGIALGPHRRYGMMCVLDFAGDITPHDAIQLARNNQSAAASSR